jgi:hypothetical protein
MSTTTAETGHAWRGRQVLERLNKSPVAMRLPLPGKPPVEVHMDRVRAAPAIMPTVSGSLGLFSIGLGLAELLAPTTIRRELGLRHVPTTAVRLVYGLRELTVGWGLVSDPTDSRLLWARVAGDLLDIATLKSADTWLNPRRRAAKVALAAVYAVTVVDLVTAFRMSTVKRNCTQEG